MRTQHESEDSSIRVEPLPFLRRRGELFLGKMREPRTARLVETQRQRSFEGSIEQSRTVRADVAKVAHHSEHRTELPRVFEAELPRDGTGVVRDHQIEKIRQITEAQGFRHRPNRNGLRGILLQVVSDEIFLLRGGLDRGTIRTLPSIEFGSSASPLGALRGVQESRVRVSRDIARGKSVRDSGPNADFEIG